MYAASPSLLWIWPPKPSSPLTISTFSSSFARRSPEAEREQREEQAQSKGDLELSAEKKGMISDKGVGIEGSGALDQRVVLGWVRSGSGGVRCGRGFSSRRRRLGASSCLTSSPSSMKPAKKRGKSYLLSCQRIRLSNL
uniref:Uncharacterized protein n=1 Tax=Ananas comosus var. bracteatus TaxID=296719 RepID=A0A6V7PPU1_ANACO|nr:unnamed protein product [Ananas comosus var. bracteatus]